MHQFMFLIAITALLFVWRGLKAFNSTDDAFGQFELLLKEEVNPSIFDMTLPTDDVSWSLLDTFQPVDVAGRTTNRAGVSSEGAAGWEASWRVMTQRGGGITGGTFSGNTLVTSGPGNKQIMGTSAYATYMNPANTPMRSFDDIKMLLRRVIGQIVINRQQIFADLASRPIAQVAADAVEDAVFQVRSLWEALFWSQGYGVVAFFNEAGNVEEAQTNYFAVDNGTIHRFVPGQRYYAATMTGTQPTAYIDGNGANSGAVGIFRCTQIDIDTGKVGFQSETGMGTIAVSDGDGIVLYGINTISGGASTSLAMESIETLLRATGNYPGTAKDVATYVYLKSFVEGSESALVEPEIDLLIKIIDKMSDAGKPVPPMVVAEASVWSRMALLEKQNYGTVQIPQGGQFMAAPGVAGPALSHQSYNFQRVVSAKCRPGAWHGFDPATFKRFMPLGNTIKWLMNQGGVSNQSGIFRLFTSDGIATEMSVADYDFFCQLGQEDPRSAFRRIGLYSMKTAS